MTRCRRLGGALLLCALAATSSAVACESDASAIFACEAVEGRKFIEPCSSAIPMPLD